MADEPQANGAAPAGVDPSQIKQKVLAQYIRDMSFENVLAQKGHKGELQPEMSVQVNLDARKRPTDGQYEVITKLKITSKAKGADTVLFLMELEYAAVFEISGLPEEQMHPYLLIECPRLTFPFVRRIVSDVTRDGGFPPLNLDNIDFLALYRTELARRVETQKAAKSDETPSA